ncbi:MAG: EAL domain-containing protein [Gammaproteobacteria bacterium]|jgi:diguanylate cyclase (GGDEF)-like protein/PAS domain S-box-containing protein|nr:EAL domain-containing protein [Gammaproteobacteria bacterium]
MENSFVNFEEKNSRFDKPVSFLVVDDDARARESLSMLLQRNWSDITEAEDGEVAISLIEQRQFKIIILDLNMPKKSGDQVLAFIRDRKINTTVIVLSGETSINKVTEAVRLGAYDIFKKPYSFDELEHAIHNALDKARVEEEKSQIQSRLAHSERLHRYMVDNSPDLIYILNLKGEFSFVNDSVTKLLGYDKSDLLGKHYSHFIADEDRMKAEYLFNERRRASRSNRMVELSLKCNSADPSKPFDVSVRPIELNSMGIYSVDIRDSKKIVTYQGTYGVARDISSRKKAEKLITFQAYHDLLTKLPNRAMLLDRLDLAIKQSVRSHETLIVMFLDLDRFKLINDSFGHVVGDQLLVEVAARLKQEIRTGDTLARLGGDEFMLLLPQPTTRVQAESVAQKLIQSLQQPFFLRKKEVYINVSIGISVFPDDSSDINTLIKNADMAMYDVKSSGKNGYTFYNDKLEHAAAEKISIESGLRNALKNGELEIFYQPQVNVHSRQIVGVEALLRWNHPQLGLRAPGYFIEQAEESRIIQQISEWVLNRVATDLFADARFLKSNIKVSINLSASDIRQKEFPENLVAFTESFGIDPGRLEIEITENMFMSDIQACTHKLQVLSNRGISIAIDDFGTGYSSLNYLRELPVHTVKIDYSFVSEIEHSSKGAALVAAIVGMAHGLGIDLVAEGVENDYQANYLESLGCHTMQGFLFSKPLKVEEFLSRIGAQQVDIPSRSNA